MPVTIGMQFPRHPGTFQGSETFTQSTATAARALSNDVDVSFVGMGTATAGHVHNLYHLTSTTTASGVEGDAVEGALKLISATATGRADVFVEMATGRLPLQAGAQIVPAATDHDVAQASATGSFVFLTASDYLLLRLINGVWLYENGAGATMATAS